MSARVRPALLGGLCAALLLPLVGCAQMHPDAPITTQAATPCGTVLLHTQAEPTPAVHTLVTAMGRAQSVMATLTCKNHTALEVYMVDAPAFDAWAVRMGAPNEGAKTLLRGVPTVVTQLPRTAATPEGQAVQDLLAEFRIAHESTHAWLGHESRAGATEEGLANWVAIQSMQGRTLHGVAYDGPERLMTIVPGLLERGGRSITPLTCQRAQKSSAYVLGSTYFAWMQACADNDEAFRRMLLAGSGFQLASAETLERCTRTRSQDARRSESGTSLSSASVSAGVAAGAVRGAEPACIEAVSVNAPDALAAQATAVSPEITAELRARMNIWLRQMAEARQDWWMPIGYIGAGATQDRRAILCDDLAVVAVSMADPADLPEKVRQLDAAQGPSPMVRVKRLTATVRGGPMRMWLAPDEPAGNSSMTSPERIGGLMFSASPTCTRGVELADQQTVVIEARGRQVVVLDQAGRELIRIATLLKSEPVCQLLPISLQGLRADGTLAVLELQAAELCPRPSLLGR